MEVNSLEAMPYCQIAKLPLKHKVHCPQSLPRRRVLLLWKHTARRSVEAFGGASTPRTRSLPVARERRSRAEESRNCERRLLLTHCEVTD